jgi:hypothetical protein
MMRHSRPHSCVERLVRATLGVLVSLWLGITGLQVVAGGKPEALLVATFDRFGRADAFQHLNDVSMLFCRVHSFLVLLAITAARSRWTDVLSVFMIGSVITLAIARVALCSELSP